MSQDGPEGLTTNRIAKAAGVSIGSVYQYFPNKQAILVAVADQQAAELEGRLQQLLRASEGIPIDALVPAMVRGIFSVRSQHSLLAALAGQSLDLPGALNRRIDLAERMRTVIRRLLQRRAHELRPMDPDVVAFVVVHAVQGTVVAIDRGVEPWFSDQQELIDELTLLLRRYIAPA